MNICIIYLYICFQWCITNALPIAGQVCDLESNLLYMCIYTRM